MQEVSMRVGLRSVGAGLVQFRFTPLVGSNRGLFWGRHTKRSGGGGGGGVQRRANICHAILSVLYAEGR